MKKRYFLPFALLPGVLLAPPGHAQTTPATAAATGTVSGVVRQAADNTALPGVNVIVKGTSNGTATGADGRYTLSGVPAGATLVYQLRGLRAAGAPRRRQRAQRDADG